MSNPCTELPDDDNLTARAGQPASDQITDHTEVSEFTEIKPTRHDDALVENSGVSLGGIRPVVSPEAVHFVNNELGPYVVNTGLLKQVRDRQRIREGVVDYEILKVCGFLEERLAQQSNEFLASNRLAPELADRIDLYFEATRSLIESRSGWRDYRSLIENIFEPELLNPKKFARLVAAHPKSVILFNHHNRTPEINGAHPSKTPFGDHDVTPLLSEILTSRALGAAEGNPRVTRFGKPLFPDDDFYYEASEKLGFRKISSQGVIGLAEQFQEAWAAGEIPTACPEAGMRALHIFRSGAIVSAVLAEAEQIILVVESPWMSVLDPRKTYEVVGALEITDELRDAVRSTAGVDENRADKKTVIDNFVTQCRNRLGDGILESQNFAESYVQEVRNLLYPH